MNNFDNWMKSLISAHNSDLEMCVKNNSIVNNNGTLLIREDLLVLIDSMFNKLLDDTRLDKFISHDSVLLLDGFFEVDKNNYKDFLIICNSFDKVFGIPKSIWVLDIIRQRSNLNLFDKYDIDELDLVVISSIPNYYKTWFKDRRHSNLSPSEVVVDYIVYKIESSKGNTTTFNADVINLVTSNSIESELINTKSKSNNSLAIAIICVMISLIALTVFITLIIKK